MIIFKNIYTVHRVYMLVFDHCSEILEIICKEEKFILVINFIDSGHGHVI